MPDWCDNELVVTAAGTGPTPDLVEFRERVRDGDEVFSFEGILPTPTKLVGVHGRPEDEDVDAVIDGRRPAATEREWHLARWGCAGRPRDTELIEGGPHRLVYRIVTPVHPPRPLLNHISQWSLAIVLENRAPGHGAVRFQGGQREVVDR